MNELYDIMQGLLDLEYKQEAFLQILKAAEAAYGQHDEQKEMKMLISSRKWQIEGYRRDLRQIVSALDGYIARNASLRK